MSEHCVAQVSHVVQVIGVACVRVGNPRRAGLNRPPASLPI